MPKLLALVLLAQLALPSRVEQGRPSLAGAWHIDLWLDSVGSLGPHPTTRHIQGTLALDSAALAPDSSATSMGRFNVDFTPFFGTQVAEDVSTSLMGPVTRGFWTEVAASIGRQDSVWVQFIPRMTHGAISLQGRLGRDTVTGQWYQRAYCCGAVGHFTLTRVSSDPVRFIQDPVPPPPPPPTAAQRGEIRVRVWDSARARYLELRHGLGHGQESKWSYTNGTLADGWGPTFWLLPGDYAVILQEIPCGSEQQFLAHEIRHPFHVDAADTLDITVTINTDSIPLTRSYKNPNGTNCSELRRRPH